MFLNENHKERYNDLLTKDSTHIEDIERRSFFYIIAGNNDLYKQVDIIYDFNRHILKGTLDEDYNCYLRFDNLILTGSTTKLLNLAIQFYNGQGTQNVLETFCCLDEDNFKLAFNSIKIRFSKV